MLKALQKSYPIASAIYIEHKKIAYPRIVIKADLSLFVRVPLHFSHAQIESFIYAYHKWIESTLHKLHTRHLALQSTLCIHHHQIPIFGVWQDINALFDTLRTPQRQLKDMLSAYIMPKVAEYAALMSLTYHSIKITSATSRFGSCTYDNRLFFSLMLIFAPKHLINYVIIHELAHITHKNHSRDFWYLVHSFCPNAKSLRSSLRQEARIYPLLLQKIADFTSPYQQN